MIYTDENKNTLFMAAMNLCLGHMLIDFQFLPEKEPILVKFENRNGLFD